MILSIISSTKSTFPTQKILTDHPPFPEYRNLHPPPPPPPHSDLHPATPRDPDRRSRPSEILQLHHHRLASHQTPRQHKAHPFHDGGQRGPQGGHSEGGRGMLREDAGPRRSGSQGHPDVERDAVQPQRELEDTGLCAEVGAGVHPAAVFEGRNLEVGSCNMDDA